MKTKRKYLKNYIHPKLIYLCTSKNYSESGEVLDTREPFFSWSPCDCCNSSLGGDRYECDPIIDSKDSHPLTNPVVYVCVDCVIKFQ